MFLCNCPPGKILTEYTIEIIFSTTQIRDGGLFPCHPGLFSSTYGSGNNDKSCFINIASGKLCLGNYDPTLHHNISSNIFVADGKKHKIVVIKDKSNTSFLYLDGNLVYRVSNAKSK